MVTLNNMKVAERIRGNAVSLSNEIIEFHQKSGIDMTEEVMQYLKEKLKGG
jgi:hypothetical protein